MDKIGTFLTLDIGEGDKMLVIKFVNDGTGTPPEVVGNYDYEVFLNRTKIAEGRVENHNRKHGWKGLVHDLLFTINMEKLREERG